MRSPEQPSKPLGALRRIGFVAILLTLAVATGACDGATGDPDPRSSTTSATGAGVDVRIAAPTDCNLNAACAPGMRSVYSAEVSRSLVPVTIDAAMTVLDNRDADVAVVSSLHPDLALEQRSDLVVLEDDKQMIGPGNIVPIVRKAAIEATGSQLTVTLDAISALLEEKPLAMLVADAESLGSEREAAMKAIDQANVNLPQGSNEGTLKVGAQSFAENRVLAHLYAEALNSAGYTAEVVDVDGYRSTMVLSLVYGDVDLTPEYLAPLADFLAGYGVIDWSDPGSGLGELRDLISSRDLVAAEPSPAQSTNAFVMRAERAEELGVSSLSDLAALLPPAEEVAFPTDFPTLMEGSGPDDPGVGASGERVVDVQLILLGLGFDPGEPDGRFGQETREAVVQFQLSQGLQADGVVGPATWEALQNPAPIDPSFFEPEPSAPEGVAPPSNERGDSGSGPVVYLTFDDGPHGTYTPQILELLAQYNAKATFFVTGQNVSAKPELAARIANEGHSVQSHTWDHADLRKLDRSTFNAQVRNTSDAIERVAGTRPTCLRPPYGARNERVTGWLSEEGMRMVLWDVDPQDWRKPGAGTIVSEVLGHVKDGSVVLLHDAGGDRTQTVKALERILETLSGEGYRFVAGCN